MSFESAYQETIAYLYGLQKHGIKLGLSNSIRLMEALGNPHRKFRSIHIAGTNGKGSTAAFIAGMLQAAGYRVGLYTSPHLVSFTERIRINGIPLSEESVVDLVQRMRAVSPAVFADNNAEGFIPTFFEVTTALAFTFFAQERVDIAVIETGMGGQFDATNVVTPAVSVITNIDLEHTELLGSTLEQIATEKAGIIKPGVPVVTGAVQPEALRVLEHTAAARQAPLYCLPRDFMPKNRVQGRGLLFDYQGLAVSYDALRVSLLGKHQADNASCALAAIECLRSEGVTVDESAVRRGLAETCWEGRMEQVGERPDVFLDGAHNPASAKQLAGTVRELRSGYRRVVLIIGILQDKDYQGILTELVPLADCVVVTKPKYVRAMEPSALEAEVLKLHDQVILTETVEDAVAQARKAASSEDLILITGSLYVVGEARVLFFPHVAPTTAFSGLQG